MSAPEAELDLFLVEQGLCGSPSSSNWTRLAGGVSSDVWKVEIEGRAVCVKRAVGKLNVREDWFAPVERSRAEWAYLQLASHIAPDSVPRPIAYSVERGMMAMSWLSPEMFALWKTELFAGRVNPATAEALAAQLGRIHAVTAFDQKAAAPFCRDSYFHQLRIEPYFLATAEKNPEFREQLEALAARTGETQIALVHGDVSPKNVLAGSNGVVLLDAECACFGDPAFDLAFCLTHLVVKRRLLGAHAAALDACFERLCAVYFSHVVWEPVAELEARTARLLPALTLARVDGKSPLEYLNDRQKDSLARASRTALRADLSRLKEVRDLLVAA